LSSNNLTTVQCMSSNNLHNEHSCSGPRKWTIQFQHSLEKTAISVVSSHSLVLAKNLFRDMGQIFIPADNVASSLQLSPRYSVQLLLNYLWWSTGHLQKQSSYLYSVHFP